jgi:hypothetical protein
VWFCLPNFAPFKGITVVGVAAFFLIGWIVEHS